MYTSSQKQLPEVFCKKDVLETWEISHENICVGVFFNKITTWKPVTLLKKTQTQVFSCEIFGNLRTPILKNICQQLLLYASEK